MDYGVFDSYVEYVATVLCWSKQKYEEQKEILEEFLCLRGKGHVPAYITSEDIKDWIVWDARKILWERFQMDLYSQQDSLIHLVWEVNMRLKLQDISFGLGMSPCTSELPALNVYDTQHAALSDLESTAFNKLAGSSVVQRAIQEITEALAHPLPRPAHTMSEVVGETVTILLAAVMETANKTESGRAFSDMAVGMVGCVLEDLRAAGRGEEQVFGLRCWRWARASMVGALHRDLLEQTGSPGALQAALRGNNATVTAAITAAITTLLTASDATPNVSPAEDLMSPAEDLMSPAEDLMSPAEDLITPAEDLITPAEDLITPAEDLITPAEDLITPAEDPMSPAEDPMSPAEDPMSLAEDPMSLAEDPITPAEQRGVQDGFEVENTAPLGRAAGEPLDLPQKKKQRKGVRRFLSRLWKVLKLTCCCCSVSVET